MRRYHNIEKSAFKPGQYVGYASGRVYRIRKTNSRYGNWIAVVHTGMYAPDIYAFTLSSMSEKLDAHQGQSDLCAAAIQHLSR